MYSSPAALNEFFLDAVKLDGCGGDDLSSTQVESISKFALVTNSNKHILEILCQLIGAASSSGEARLRQALLSEIGQ